MHKMADLTYGSVELVIVGEAEKNQRQFRGIGFSTA